MSTSHSDALVFFGATGDLAYKKIFPSLQAMVKHGNLDVLDIPVTCTEILVRFRHPPNVYSDLATTPNHLRFRISPKVQFAMGMLVMVDDEKMTGALKELEGTPAPISDEKDACERVLTDAIQGDAVCPPGLH
jgi:glucose-6-phosphate 1-dehydrogenase